MFIYFSMSTTFGSKDIVIRKSEFVAKTQFLYFHKEILSVISSSLYAMMTITSNEGKRSFSLQKRILDDLALMAHY